MEKIIITATAESVEQVKELLKEKTDINATLINPRFISGIDKEVLEKLSQAETKSEVLEILENFEEE